MNTEHPIFFSLELPFQHECYPHKPVWFQSDPHKLGVFNSPQYRNVRNMLSRHGLAVSGSYVSRQAQCALQTALGKAKIHDNYVYFDKSNLIPQVEPPVSAIRPTKRATPWAKEAEVEPPLLPSLMEWLVSSNCTWYETEEVAQFFNGGITPDNALGLDTSAESDPPLPSELNFAVSRTLSVTMHNTTRVCPEMKIAQGHRVSTNNWWIAGTKCHHAYEGLMCPCGNHNVTFFDDGLARTSNIFSVHFPIDTSKPAT